MILRGSKAAPRQTGRMAILLTPTIATSGELITGVETMPPSAPRLVMVMVEPVSSSRLAVPERAASLKRATSLAQSQIVSASACCTTGTMRPFGVCTAIPMCTPP